ncbi:MAG: HU family DNA-binding protein [Alphaproteobacteria bacterium]|nr:HU family DNA-binding protein [Alphaproteobacteria bacterium]
MNKQELITQVSQHSGLTKADAERALDATIHAIQATLKSGDDVRLVGFGTFTTAQRQKSEGRNPRTGEKITIAATRLPKFRAGKQLKDAVAK